MSSLQPHSRTAQGSGPGQIEFHPFADIFPMMDEAGLAELAADIKAESQREPIYLWQGRIIDGRNRYRACAIAGVEPVVKRIEFPGGDKEAIAFVVSRNLKRRHLSVTQRSDVARKLATLPHGVRPDTARAVSAMTQEQAAKALNVSVDSIQRSRVVHERGSPELIAAVAAGETSLRKAAETVRRPPGSDPVPARERAAPEPPQALEPIATATSTRAMINSAISVATSAASRLARPLRIRIMAPPSSTS